MSFHNQDYPPLKNPLKRDKTIPGNKTIGIPIGLMIPPVQIAEALLRGTIQDTLRSSHQFLWILPTIRRILFWILVVHDQLDRGRQSQRSRNMRYVMVYRQNSVSAINLLCLPTLRQKRVGKVELFTFQQHHHAPPELMCLRRVMCLSSSPFYR